jgi:hypothetical protein
MSVRGTWDGGASGEPASSRLGRQHHNASAELGTRTFESTQTSQSEKHCALPHPTGVRLLISEAAQTIANAPSSPPVEVVTRDMKSVLERTLRWMRGHRVGQRGRGFVIAVKVLLAVIKVGISTNVTSLPCR